MVISGTTGIDFGNTPILNASSAQVQGKQVTPYSGFKNYIINGNFDIWQYKDAGLPYPQTTNGYGSDDRWINYNSGSTKTTSQIACTDTERALFNASYFSRTVVTSVAGSTNHTHKVQFIEDVTRLAGKTVTVSFWAKADTAKNMAFNLGQVFGSGGTPSSSVYNVGIQLIPLTSTWQKFTITATIPSIVGKTLGTNGVHTTSTYIRFWFDAGNSYNAFNGGLGQQSGTFDIAQVQLEEGSVATPFENRPYGLELSLCQRYYETGQAKCYIATSANGMTLGNNFKVTKRVTPSMVTTGGIYQPSSYEEVSNEFFRAHRSTGNELAFYWSASAEL